VSSAMPPRLWLFLSRTLVFNHGGQIRKKERVRTPIALFTRGSTRGFAIVSFLVLPIRDRIASPTARRPHASTPTMALTSPAPFLVFDYVAWRGTRRPLLAASSAHRPSWDRRRLYRSGFLSRRLLTGMQCAVPRAEQCRHTRPVPPLTLRVTGLINHLHTTPRIPY